MGLFRAALTGESDTDWDAALAELEHRMEYGDDDGEADEDH